MMMISARSPKTSRRHIAKVSMSNSYSMDASNVTSDKSNQIESLSINEASNDYYKMGGRRSSDETSKISLSSSNSKPIISNFESASSSGVTSKKLNQQDQSLSGKIYKKHHHHQNVVDSQIGFLPKPDTSTLIKNIDKKLQATDTILIVSKNGRSKLVKSNKKTSNNNKNNNTSLLLDTVAMGVVGRDETTSNSLNNSNTSLNALAAFDNTTKVAVASRKAATNNFFSNQNSESFDTFNENDYYTKSIGDVIGGGGKKYKSKFHSKSTVIFDETSSSKNQSLGGGEFKMVPEASFLRAKDLYRKYKEKVK